LAATLSSAVHAKPFLQAFVSPTGRGNGTTPWLSAPIEALPSLVGSLGAGAVIGLIADRGEFVLDDPIILTSGGSPERPVRITGVGSDGSPAKAVLRGTRKTWVYPDSEAGAVNASKLGGNTAFVLTDRCSHIEFTDLGFVDTGCPFDMSGLNGSGVRIEDVVFQNVRDGIYTDEHSDVSEVTIRRFSGAGFSKKGIRFHGKCANWLIEDCDLDSRWQYGDNFAVGIEASDSAHDLEIRGGSTSNALDQVGEDDEHYWNGDGVASERGNWNITIVGHRSSGNSDSGYDLKSESTQILECHSADNKRNFRIWGGIGLSPVAITNCTSLAPTKRGGTGGVHHVWLQGTTEESRDAASVLLTQCVLRGGAGSVIYADGGNVAAHMVDCTVEDANGLELFEANDDSSRLLQGVTGKTPRATIHVPTEIVAIEAVRRIVNLEADAEVTWRVSADRNIVDLSGAQLLVGASSRKRRETFVVQSRDRLGIPQQVSVTLDVIANPVSYGTVLATVIDPSKKSIADATGLNNIRLSRVPEFSTTGFQFDGKGSSAEIEDFGYVDLTGPFSIRARFSVDAPASGGTKYVISVWSQSEKERGFAFRIDGSGQVEFAWRTAGKGGEQSKLVGPALKARQIYEVAAERDSAGTMRLYVDGQMVAKAENAVGALRTAAQPLRIGGRPVKSNKVTGELVMLTINQSRTLADSDEGYEVV
jgi:hypothetical protein